MKKIILLSFILLLLVFSGCKKKEEPIIVLDEQVEIVRQDAVDDAEQTEPEEVEGIAEESQETTDEQISEIMDVTTCENDCKTLDIDLSDYPTPFIKNGKLNAYIIVGAKATSLEVVANTELLAGIEFTSRIGDYAPDILDTDLNSIADKNAILIGNPCNNKFIAKLSPYDTDCLEEYEQGEAILKLFKTGTDTYALVVGGYSGQDTRRAAQFLGNHKNKNLKGNEMTV